MGLTRRLRSLELSQKLELNFPKLEGTPQRQTGQSWARPFCRTSCWSSCQPTSLASVRHHCHRLPSWSLFSTAARTAFETLFIFITQVRSPGRCIQCAVHYCWQELAGIRRSLSSFGFCIGRWGLDFAMILRLGMRVLKDGQPSKQTSLLHLPRTLHVILHQWRLGKG